jgi:hypothetical protein
MKGKILQSRLENIDETVTGIGFVKGSRKDQG